MPAVSDPPSISVDRLRTIAVLVVAVFAAGGAAYSYDAGVVKRADLHVSVLDGDGHEVDHPLVEMVAAHEQALGDLPAMKKAIDEANRNSLTVKNGFFNERASRLGSRAADTMPDGTHWRNRKIKSDQVKRQALNNLNAGRPIEVGIEQYAF